MFNKSVTLTLAIVIGAFSCAETNTSALKVSQADARSDRQRDQTLSSARGGASASGDRCEKPNSLGNLTGDNNYEGEDSFSLRGPSSAKAGDPYKPVKSVGDGLIVGIAGGPIGSAILPNSFKESSCNAGWMNSSRTSAIRIISSFQNCFHVANKKRFLVIKREHAIAECVAQYNEDVVSSGLSQECSSYMKNPCTRQDLENSVLSEWSK